MIKRRFRWVQGLFSLVILIYSVGYSREILDLYPEQPGALICWTENRTDPRPLQICFLKIALNVKELEVIALPGDDPDGPGPAESRLTKPLLLFEKYHALAAVNANAFAGLEENKSAYPRWYEGQPVDIHGFVVSQGKIISPIESGRTPFWMDAARELHIGNPADGKSPIAAVSDWFSSLLIKSRIIPEAADAALHPRTALGFDDSGTWLLLVVVDGRQPGFSEGVTLYELATILRSEGCTQSINMDGGGSSIMLIRGPDEEVRTLNSPSGRAHRPVPVMLGVRRSTN